MKQKIVVLDGFGGLELRPLSEASDTIDVT